MHKIKKLNITDEDFNKCGDWLTTNAAAKFLQGNYTHLIDGDYTYSIELHNFNDGTKGILISEIYDAQN